ncbi:MAG: DUF2892 domain-containing protein [Pseudomonadota bacterium]
MTKNVGSIDRGLRILLALGLVIAAFTVPAVQGGVLQWVALIAAAVFAFTSFISFCPLYRIFGMRTCA